MRELERDLDTKLFEQLGKSVALTVAGKLLVQYAIRLIAAMGDARKAIEDLQGMERGLLRIGASTTQGLDLIPQMSPTSSATIQNRRCNESILDTRAPLTARRWIKLVRKDAHGSRDLHTFD